MDDKLNALDKLIEAVEAGAVSDWAFGSGYPRTVLGDKWETGMNAYCGSLDAALALHEALLPNSGWKVCKLLCESTYTVEVWGEYAYSESTGTAPNPARAWLIAVLKAYREITH